MPGLGLAGAGLLAVAWGLMRATTQGWGSAEVLGSLAAGALLVLAFLAWERRTSPFRGDLWWVHAVSGGPVFLGGGNANILRYQAGSFERMPTPGLGKDIVFGI